MAIACLTLIGHEVDASWLSCFMNIQNSIIVKLDLHGFTCVLNCGFCAIVKHFGVSIRSALCTWSIDGLQIPVYMISIEGATAAANVFICSF